MIKKTSNRKRNVEDIRRKNLEDNQIFLEKLLITDIRNDFVKSARSILRKKENTKSPIERKKIEYSTRYNVKVKSGVIPPHVPEWQREIQRKLLEKEQQQEAKEMKKEQKQQAREMKRQESERKKEEILFVQELRKIERELMIEEKERIRLVKQRPPEPSKWTLFYKNNSNPYQRLFKPRHTKVSERIEQNLF